jgi:hypothetical protein
VSYSPSFERKCRVEANNVFNHIKATLKVGRENAMHHDDILIKLEHHGIIPPDYIFSGALALAGETNDIKCIDRCLYYIRKAGESRDYGWY